MSNQGEIFFLLKAYTTRFFAAGVSNLFIYIFNSKMEMGGFAILINELVFF